jgi:hypothetical protein
MAASAASGRVSIASRSITEKNAALHFNRSVGCLVENASHVAVTLRRTVPLGNPGTLFITRASSHPGRKLLGGRECCRANAHLGDDLLGRTHAQPGHSCQTLDRLLMLAELSPHLLIESGHLLVDQLQSSRSRGWNFLNRRFAFAVALDIFFQEVIQHGADGGDGA